jgi:outer membrane receptor protein involved in Fe transport
VLFGAESKFIDGASQEIQLTRGRVLGTSDNGGTQRTGSIFVQDTFLASDRLTVVAGAHGDGWHSESQNTPYSKTLGSFNPRASLAYRLGAGVSIRGSAYGGFRAPTLNELYRGFRAGNTQTNPNEALLPERLTGADGGVLVARGRVSARVTGFWNVLDDAITNITLSTTPQLITKQRANADQMRSTGLEFESDVKLPASLSVGFSSAVVIGRLRERRRQRAVQGRDEPARQPRAAGTRIQRRREPPLQPGCLDGLEPAACDRRTIRGRPESLHLAPGNGS